MHSKQNYMLNLLKQIMSTGSTKTELSNQFTHFLFLLNSV